LQNSLIRIYKMLREHFGPGNWWPGETPFEVMVGAILTQSAAWTNVEKAISNLKDADALDPYAISKMDIRKLRRLIRPCGYYNQKAKKLKAFIRFYLAEPLCGSPERMARIPPEDMREQLLNINGIGPETADSIMLYALEKPVFVVDAYTRRIFYRLGFTRERATYDEIQEFFMRNLPEEIELYNDYHAQIVNLGKEYCRKKPRCDACPLSDICRKRLETT
jgi:endonuclease-3 related protein